MTAPVTPATLSKLRTELRDLLGDTGATSFSPEQCDDAINEAIADICQIRGYSYIEVPACSSLSLSSLVTYSPAAPPMVFPLIGSFPGIPAASLVVGASYTVTTVGTTNWSTVGATAVGSPPSYLGVTFTATAAGTGTGVAKCNYDYTDYIKIKRILSGGVSHLYKTADVHELTETTLDIESMHNPDWRKDFGEPKRWCFWQGDNLVLFKIPYPSNVVGTWSPSPLYLITIGYIQTPLLLSAEADVVDSRIPPLVHPYIKYRAAAWLLNMDNTDSASLATAKTYLDVFISLIGG